MKEQQITSTQKPTRYRGRPLWGGEMIKPKPDTIPEFKEFPKIPRWSRDIIVTEKIDGTNMVVYVPPQDSTFPLLAGSKNTWILPQVDSYGFYSWVREHDTELRSLGPGYHRGEWWGFKINRGYNIKDRRWSLLNTTKWRETKPPSCCHVVPVLYEGIMSEASILNCLGELKNKGSVAAPGFMRAEGIIIYHVGGLFFKKTLEKDELPKNKANE